MMSVTLDPRSGDPARPDPRPNPVVDPAGSAGSMGSVSSVGSVGTDERRYAAVGALHLESGRTLPDVTVAYETWGRLNAAGDNAVLVEHALTGDSHVIGPAGAAHPTAGWWQGLIGPGCPLDSDDLFIVASNVLGGCRGTTGPASTAPDGRPWGSRFPAVTIRDQVEAEARLARHLGVTSWAGVIGGSMGGMRVLEWAVTHPDLVRTAVVLASTAYATADQIAWCQPQILAITTDPDFAGGDYYGTGRAPDAGLGIARRIAHITYRSEAELAERFGRSAQGDDDPVTGSGRFAVESYLDHHATKLVGRYDANSYVVLSRSMNSHDVGRGRGGVAAALAGVRAHTVAVAVDSDRLYPPHLSAEIAAGVPGGVLEVVESGHGHDGFLIETEAVARVLRAHVG